MKSSWWKAILKYAIGVILLTYTIGSNWYSHDHHVERQRLGIVAGGAATVKWNSHDKIGISEILSKPKQYDLYALVGLLVVINTSLTFVRWYLLVRAQNLPFTLKSAFRLGLVGYFYNTFLPGSVGGDLVKAASLANEHERRAVAVATVIVDRVIGLWGLVILVALTGSAFWLFSPKMMQPYLRQTVTATLVLLAISLVGWAMLGVLPEKRAQRFAGRLKAIPKVGGTVSELWQAVWLYRLKGKTILAALGMTLVGHTCSVLAFFLAVATFQPAGDLSKMPGVREHFLVAPFGLIAQGFFPAPGGVGGGEFAYGWLYENILGFPGQPAIIGCLAVRVWTWIFGAVGLAVHSFLKRDEADAMSASITPVAVPGLPIRLHSPSDRQPDTFSLAPDAAHPG